MTDDKMTAEVYVRTFELKSGESIWSPDGNHICLEAVVEIVDELKWGHDRLVADSGKFTGPDPMTIERDTAFNAGAEAAWVSIRKILMQTYRIALGNDIIKDVKRPVAISEEA